MQTPLQVVRKSAFTAIPWKNGGGITHEALRVPQMGDPFRWRVSVAHIDVSGPFSDFGGYHRKMVLLRGSGVILKFAGGETRELCRIGDLVEFDGAESTYCELQGGACVDLNLMVSKSIAVDARVLRLDVSIAVEALQNTSTLIFAVEDPLLLESDSGDTVRLEPWDLAVINHGGGRLNRVAGNIATVGSVFIATLDHQTG